MEKLFIHSKRKVSVIILSILGLSTFIFLLSAWFVALFVLVIFNLKTIKTKNKSLLTLSSRLQETLDKKNQLFSIIGHDLKSPFNSIIGFSDLLLLKYNSIDDKKQEEMISIINRSSKNALELLNNLLDWGKIENDNVLLEKSDINLFEIINSEILFFRVLLENKKIIPHNNIPANTLAFADCQMIKTVVRNILSNAIKFSFPENIIEISSSYTSGYVQVTISDNGVGLTNDQINQLFNQYSTSTSGTKNEPGTGLGLYISKKLIEKK